MKLLLYGCEGIKGIGTVHTPSPRTQTSRVYRFFFFFFVTASQHHKSVMYKPRRGYRVSGGSKALSAIRSLFKAAAFHLLHNSLH